MYNSTYSSSDGIPASSESECSLESCTARRDPPLPFVHIHIVLLVRIVLMAFVLMAFVVSCVWTGW